MRNIVDLMLTYITTLLQFISTIVVVVETVSCVSLHTHYSCKQVEYSTQPVPLNIV
jgi:hypothetical protein